MQRKIDCSVLSVAFYFFITASLILWHFSVGKMYTLALTIATWLTMPWSFGVWYLFMWSYIHQADDRWLFETSLIVSAFINAWLIWRIIKIIHRWKISEKLET